MTRPQTMVVKGYTMDMTTKQMAFSQEATRALDSKPLDESIENLREVVEQEFKRPSFQCREDLALCERRYGWWGCRFLMITCVGTEFMQAISK